MPFPITGIVAVTLFALSLLLSTRVSFQRGKVGVALGDGGNPVLLERMRQHGNLMENAPSALILLGLAEAQGVSSFWLWISAAILIAARLVHPFGIHHDDPANKVRIVGAVATSVAMLITSIGILRMTFGI